MSALVIASNGFEKFQAIIPGVSQNVAVGSGSLQSTAFQTTTSIVRVSSNVDCYIVFAANPTATSSGVFLPASSSEYFGVTGGQKVAVIQSSTTGILNVVEGA